MSKTIEKYALPKNDMIFLKIVETNKTILKSILESSLNTKVSDIMIKNSKLYKNREKSKSNFLDLIVKVDDYYVNIEINTSWNENIKERNIRFLYNLENNVTVKGENKYPRVVQINFIFDKCTKYTISRNKIIDEDTYGIYTDSIEIINVGVDKAKEKYYNSNKKLTRLLPIAMLGFNKKE